MFPNTIYTLTEDTDSGLNTTIHTSAYTAYLALIVSLFGQPGPNQKASDAAWRTNSLHALHACEDAEGADGVPIWEKYSGLTDYLEDIIEKKEFLYNIEAHSLQDAFNFDLRATIDAHK